MNSNLAGCFAPNNVKHLQWCWSCTHPCKSRIFIHLCDVPCRWWEVFECQDYLPAEIQFLTCGCSHSIHVASAAEFLINGDLSHPECWWDHNNAIECKGYPFFNWTLSFFIWFRCYICVLNVAPFVLYLCTSWLYSCKVFFVWIVRMQKLFTVSQYNWH